MITRDELVAELIDAVPEAASTVAEHLADHDELLLHLLMADLGRVSVSAFGFGRTEEVDRLLSFVNRCLREGDGDVRNAVAVSFVEDFGAHPGESDALLQRWPAALRAELGR